MIRYIDDVKALVEGEKLEKITRYPTGYFVTTSVRMNGPFRSKAHAVDAAKRAGLLPVPAEV